MLDKLLGKMLLFPVFAPQSYFILPNKQNIWGEKYFFNALSQNMNSHSS